MFTPASRSWSDSRLAALGLGGPSINWMLLALGTSVFLSGVVKRRMFLKRNPRARRMTDLDRVIHEPWRLLLVALLAAVREADFLWLLRESGPTKGNLSKHFGAEYPVTRATAGNPAGARAARATRSGSIDSWRSLAASAVARTLLGHDQVIRPD